MGWNLQVCVSKIRLSSCKLIALVFSYRLQSCLSQRVGADYEVGKKLPALDVERS